MSPKRLFYVLCGALAVIIIGGGALYYLSSRNLHAGMNTLSQKLAEEQIKDQKLSRLQDLQNQHKKLVSGKPTPLLPIINKALPTEKNQSEIALQLRDLAGQSGMQFSGLKFADSATPSSTSQTVKEGDVLAIPVSFELTGSYDELQAFLSGQERLSRLSNVTNLEISVIAPERLKFTVTLNMYMKP